MYFLPPNKVCLLCTGSQGEPLAALSRIANGSHRQIKLQGDDIVIFSSSAIPGNAVSISRTINKLYLRGVKVYTSSTDREIHASGHAMSEELKLMIRLMNPKYLMPIHGEYRMLKKHASIAKECGLSKENIFVLDNGDVLEMNKGNIQRIGNFEVTETFVDGNRIGDISGAVLNDRKIMASEGILVVIINLDMENRKLLAKPMITTRGFILVNENELLIKQIEKKAEYLINNKLKNKNTNYNDLKSEIINGLMPFLSDKTGRVPIILPIIMDIKNYNYQKNSSN